MITATARHRPGPKPRLSDDRGASMALVALSLVWMVGMAAVVVDIGGGWLSRQTLIPATDAGALAAAQDLVDAPGDHNAACLTAGRYVVANAPDATMTRCDVTTGANGGRVTVDATTDFEANFVEVESLPTSIGAGSTATWGPPRSVSGLRPMGLCYDGSAALRQLIDSPPSGRESLTVQYTKDDPSDCGGIAALGNFATIDFESGTGTSRIRNWMLNGYQEQVTLDRAALSDCSGAAICYDRPYASNDIRAEISLLRAAGTFVPFPVFNYADADEVHLVGVVRARFADFQLDGPPDTWWATFDVEPGLLAGTCCGPPQLMSGNKVIAICGVDPGSFQSCEPAAGP